jgi:anthranilate phosphoribosyltransferase
MNQQGGCTMPWTDDIQRLIQKEELSREESYAMFRQILLNDQPDLQQGAFLAALVSKGETPREIAGAWQAIVELDTNRVAEDLGSPLVENSGTGMDQLKTFNVSSAASIVAAAGGARLARHGARGLTSSCGTVDLLDRIGIDVECSVAAVARSIKEAGIGLFNGMSPKVHPQSLGRILSRIRFGSTLNIAASLASPCRPTHGLRGVYSKALLSGVAEVMKEIGYERAMVVHGFDSRKEKGMDELSTLGESIIHEFYPDGREYTFSIVPEDVGLKRSDYSAIAATGNVESEAVRFLEVISGTGHPECIDLTCLNAGAILYLVGQTVDIASGVQASRELIASGKALAKLSQWVSAQTDPKKQGIQKYLTLAAEAGIKPKHLSLYFVPER